MNFNFEDYLEYLFVTGQLPEQVPRNEQQNNEQNQNKPKEKTLKKK